MSSKTRSQIMASIPSKDTTIEVKVCKYLFSKGYRYRKNVKSLPGTPDIVLHKYNTVIFVNGCFWHKHNNCKRLRIPHTNIQYWQKKIETNALRDESNISQLTSLGWKVQIIWECEIIDDFINRMDELERELLKGKMQKDDYIQSEF